MEKFFIPMLWLAGAVAFDMIANWSLVKSKGFHIIYWAVVSVAFVSAAFGCMAQAILIIPLSTAYALWSVLGIFGTILLGKICFHQNLSRQKYVAICFLTIGVILMNVN